MSHVRVDRRIAERIKAVVEDEVGVPVSISTAVEKTLRDCLSAPEFGK